MKLVAALLLIAALPAFASNAGGTGDHDHDKIINQTSELVSWCQSEAESRYVAKNITPYQWTASYHDEGNVLYVDGRLRVHDDDVAVHCRIARGARESDAVIEIDDASL
jgi:hypothetical protein